MIGGRIFSDRTTLIRGGHVLTLDAALGDLPGADVLIDGDKIAAVGRGLTAGPHANVIDARDRIVMPGFVDTHRHTWQTPVRGVLPSCTLDQYFAGMLDNIGVQYRADDVYIANLMGALEALNAGITTLLDWSHVNNTPEHADAAVAGLTEAGIRAVYAHGVPVGADWWAYSSRPHPEDIARIRKEYFQSDDQLLTLALAARAPGNTTPDVARHDWQLARELGIRISVHVGMRLTGIHVNHVLTLNQLGLMGADTTYIHCTDSTDEELDLIAKTGGSTSVAPFVEMLMGHGVPPTGRLVARGVRPSLSIDVVSSVPGDMFTQMRTALVQERILAFTDTPDIAFAPTLTHRDVLEFATIQGAKACALDHKIGTITPGKQADIVLIRTDQVNVAPVVDPVATVVICADTSNVDTVFVAGRIVKHNGQLVRVDLPRLLQRLSASRDHLLSNAGIINHWVLSRRDA
jgi:cytosine/adenosine deaminase-related metal-dependent hydrolase